MEPFVIAHRLDKEPNAIDNALIQERETTYNPGETPTLRLINGAKNGVNRSSSIGKFERDADGQPKILERLVNQFNTDPSESNFIDFSKLALSALVDKINTKAQATGGYVLFIYYERESGLQAGQKYMVIALITNKDIPAFDENMNLIDSTVLDLEHLKHGARIKMSSLHNNNDGVIALLPSKRASTTAEYFSEFIGCSEYTNSRQMAIKLDERLEEWCQQENMTAEQRSELRFKVYSHWKSQEGAKNGISIEALGNSLYPEDNTDFVSYMTDEENGVPGQTPKIRTVDMGRFNKFKYSSPGLKLEFDTGGEHNWLNKFCIEGESVTIQEAPLGLINQIQREQSGDEQ